MKAPARYWLRIALLALVLGTLLYAGWLGLAMLP